MINARIQPTARINTPENANKLLWMLQLAYEKNAKRVEELYKRTFPRGWRVIWVKPRQ